MSLKKEIDDRFNDKLREFMEGVGKLHEHFKEELLRLQGEYRLADKLETESKAQQGKSEEKTEE